MKKAVLSSSIIAILTLCLLNFAAASPTNPGTAPHSKIVTDVKAQQPTMPTFSILSKNSSFNDSLADNIACSMTSPDVNRLTCRVTGTTSVISCAVEIALHGTKYCSPYGPIFFTTH